MQTRRRFLIQSAALLALGACAAPAKEPAVPLPAAPQDQEPLAVVLVADLAAETDPSPEVAKSFDDLQVAVLRRLEYAASRSGWFRVRRVKSAAAEAASAERDPLESLPASVPSALVVSVDHFVLVDQGRNHFAYGSQSATDLSYQADARGVRCKITLALWTRGDDAWEAVSQGSGEVDSVASRSSLQADGLLQLVQQREREKDVTLETTTGSVELDGAAVQHALDDALARALTDMVEGGLGSAIARMRAAPSDVAPERTELADHR